MIEGRHADPFRYLGPHVEGGSPVVRVFMPDAVEVTAFDDTAGDDDRSTRIHKAGLFAGGVANDASAIGCACASARPSSSWRTRIGFRRCCPISISIS